MNMTFTGCQKDHFLHHGSLAYVQPKAMNTTSTTMSISVSAKKGQNQPNLKPRPTDNNCHILATTDYTSDAKLPCC